MAAIVWGLYMEGLWRDWRFAMIGTKKLQNEEYILSSNGNACALLTFKFFRLDSRYHRVQFNTYILMFLKV